MSYYSSSRPWYTGPSTSFSDRRGSSSRGQSNYPGLYSYDWSSPKSSSSKSSAPMHYYNTYSLPRTYNKPSSSSSSKPKHYYTGSSSSKTAGGYLLGHYTLAPITNPTLAKYQQLSSNLAASYNNSPIYNGNSGKSKTASNSSAKASNSEHSKAAIVQPPRRAPSPEFIQKEQRKQQNLTRTMTNIDPEKTVYKIPVVVPASKNSRHYHEPEQKSRLSLKKRLSSSLSSLVTSISGSLSNLALSPISKPSSVEYYDSSEDEECYFDDYSDSVGSRRSSAASSDVEHGPDSKSENGLVTRVNYRKLYEETLKENQLLKSRLTAMEEQISDLRVKLERSTLTQRINPDDTDKREKRALERKLSEMEEELKLMQKLKMDSEKLKAENRALTRVVSKLSGGTSTSKSTTSLNSSSPH